MLYLVYKTMASKWLCSPVLSCGVVVINVFSEPEPVSLDLVVLDLNNGSVRDVRQCGLLNKSSQETLRPTTAFITQLIVLNSYYHVPHRT